ncbi:hypothetical protein D3C84_1008060 [compost metagenome]
MARGLQVYLFVTGTDHADNFQVGQGGDLFLRQTQGAAGQHCAEAFTVFENRRLAFGRRGRQFQVVTLLLENRQAFIDGFNQYQNGCGHAGLLWALGRFQVFNLIVGVGGRGAWLFMYISVVVVSTYPFLR